jgi:hypothetical protein
MISAWWLLGIIPMSVMLGVLLMALCVASGRSRCNDDA